MKKWLEGVGRGALKEKNLQEGSLLNTFFALSCLCPAVRLWEAGNLSCICARPVCLGNAEFNAALNKLAPVKQKPHGEGPGEGH